MKSKLFLIISALFVAFMPVNSASAQDRVKSDEVRSDRVYLTCHVIRSESNTPKVLVGNSSTMKFRLTNNTGAWLAEGTTIHFSGQGQLLAFTDQKTVALADNFKKTLDVMVEPKGVVVLWERPWPNHLVDPFTCQAWILK